MAVEDSRLPWQIREATSSDLRALYELSCRSMPLDAWTEAGVLEEMDRASSWVMVAESGGRLVGYLISSHVLDEAELLQIATDPAWLRRGIASSLFCALIERLKAARVRVLHLEVRASGTPARAFYRRWGFLETGLRPAYYRQNPEDAILLSLDIADGE